MSSSVPGLIRKTASSARRKNRLAVSSRRKRAALRMRATPVHGGADAMTTGPCGCLCCAGSGLSGWISANRIAHIFPEQGTYCDESLVMEGAFQELRYRHLHQARDHRYGGSSRRNPCTSTMARNSRFRTSNAGQK